MGKRHYLSHLFMHSSVCYYKGHKCFEVVLDILFNSIIGFSVFCTMEVPAVEKYNTQRYQYGLKKMTPEQFRGHLLAV